MAKSAKKKEEPWSEHLARDKAKLDTMAKSAKKKEEPWSEHLARDKAKLDATPAPPGIWCMSSERGLHRMTMSYTELTATHSAVEWVGYLNRLEALQNPEAQDAYDYLYKEFHKQRRVLEATAEHLAAALLEIERLKGRLKATSSHLC